MTQAFRYRAATRAGDLVDGIVNAGSPRDAADELRRQSLVPVNVEPVTPQAGGLKFRGRSESARRESTAAAFRTIATLIDAGVGLEHALDFVSRHASHPDIGAAFAAIRSEVQRGASLSDAVRQQPALGTFAAAVIHAGEESGTLAAALARLADWRERANELRAEVRSALMYPALMGAVSGVAVIILLAFVVPRFVAILGEVGGTLPLSTRLLVGASAVVVKGWWIWLPLLGAVILGLRSWLRAPSNRVRWHAVRLRLPRIGDLERATMTARFASAFGVLLYGGAPMLTALRVAREGITNLSIASELDIAADRVARGERVADALGAAFPPLAVEFLAAGEEGARLPEMSIRVARMHDEVVARSLRTLVRLIEPVLIVTFGAIVGFIALAMLQAVYSINAGVL